MTTLVLAAHGSVDPRSAANAHAVADRIRALRPGLDVRVGFCERSQPNLREVLTHNAVVVPLLLADAYHARIDIPGLIAESGAHDVRLARVLGEDPRLLTVLRDRLATVDVLPRDRNVGVLVVAVGSSWETVNTRTRALARAAAAPTRWAGAVTAFATGPRPTLDGAARRLREQGATHLVIAPWFLAPGRLTDGIDAYAQGNGIAMAPPLGAHPLLAATLLDRFDGATAVKAAA